MQDEHGTIWEFYYKNPIDILREQIRETDAKDMFTRSQGNVISA